MKMSLARRICEFLENIYVFDRLPDLYNIEMEDRLFHASQCIENLHQGYTSEVLLILRLEASRGWNIGIQKHCALPRASCLDY
jgi:hypothetical protein